MNAESPLVDRQMHDSQTVHALLILEHIEANPDATQADLASRMGVAIGTVNWYVKRLIAKGFVKVMQLQRRRVRYLITPKGISEKTRLAYKYVQVSMHMYKKTRARARELLAQVQAQGYAQVTIEGSDDLVDVCRLTCLEMGVQIATDGSTELPRLLVSGTTGVHLLLPKTREAALLE